MSQSFALHGQRELYGGMKELLVYAIRSRSRLQTSVVLLIQVVLRINSILNTKTIREDRRENRDTRKEGVELEQRDNAAAHFVTCGERVRERRGL